MFVCLIQAREHSLILLNGGLQFKDISASKTAEYLNFTGGNWKPDRLLQLILLNILCVIVFVMSYLRMTETIPKYCLVVLATRQSLNTKVTTASVVLFHSLDDATGFITSHYSSPVLIRYMPIYLQY